jgi:hypothetical protein
MTWKNITLGKYQQIEAINGRGLSDIDKALYCACVVFDKTEYQIDNEKPAKVLRMMDKMQGLFQTPFNARTENRIGKYVVNYDVSHITFGQYIELSFFIGNGPLRNVQYILATMANRWRQKHTSSDHRLKADYFRTQPVEKAIGALNIIQENYSRFNSEYKQLFGLDKEVTGEVQNDEFNKRYGWIYSATQVKEHEGITLDDTFALPVRQAFNALLFLKAKGKYEMEQLRKPNKRIV